MRTLSEFLLSEETNLDHLQNHVGDSAEVNSALRNGSKPLPHVARAIKALDSLSRPISNIHTVHRVLHDDHPENAALEKVKVGDRYHDRGFMSTTHSEKAVHHLIQSMDEWGGTPKHIMHIHSAAGVHGIDVNRHLGDSHHFAEQHEVILRRGTTLRKTGESVDAATGVRHHNFEVVE